MAILAEVERVDLVGVFGQSVDELPTGLGEDHLARDEGRIGRAAALSCQLVVTLVYGTQYRSIVNKSYVNIQKQVGNTGAGNRVRSVFPISNLTDLSYYYIFIKRVVYMGFSVHLRHYD